MPDSIRAFPVVALTARGAWRNRVDSIHSFPEWALATG
jgi:hypothetical protein